MVSFLVLKNFTLTRKATLTLLRIWGGGGGGVLGVAQKDPFYQFFLCFPQFVSHASPKLLSLNQDHPSKNAVFLVKFF